MLIVKEPEAFPGATITLAPECKPRNEQEERKMFRAWTGWSHIDFAMFHTKVRHPDHTEYQHYEDRCDSLRVYKDHAELRIPQGVIRYDLNPEFIEKLNWIDWEATKAKRGEKIKQIIADMKKQPVADLAQLKVGSVLLTGKPAYGYDHYSFHREDAIVLGVTGYRVCDDWIECIGFENFFPGESHGTHFSGWSGMSGGYTRCNTYHDIPTLQKNANLYLIQEGTGKTWEEYGSGRRPYVPRDVLSRAHATKNMVDDYLRGVGMPRNNRRVEQMLGIGY